jgi:PEP-CTERM motif
MKNTTKIMLALAGTSAFIVTSAFAQSFTNSTWTIDENGPALLSNPAGYSTGRYQPDPVSGLVGWYYPLAGTPSVAGDVLLLESQNPSAPPSDLLRFDGQGGVYFFSDEDGPPVDNADVPVMPQTINPVILYEIGPEGNNGALYVPAPGQPGYDLSGILPGIQYNIISDVPVPEPASATLLLAGAGLWLLNASRRRKL